MYISIGFLLITLHMTSIIIIRGPVQLVLSRWYKDAIDSFLQGHKKSKTSWQKYFQSVLEARLQKVTYY